MRKYLFILISFEIILSQTLDYKSGQTTTYAESAGTITLYITAASYSSFPVTVQVTDGHTDDADSYDYTFNTQTLTWNTNGDQPFTITLKDDDIDEDSETLRIGMAFNSSGTISNTYLDITITDNDGTPTMTVTNVSQLEDEDTGWAAISVSIDRPSTTSTRPGFSVSVGGTATGGGVDYNALSPTSYTFSSSNTSTATSFNIYIQDDTKDEDSETITFTITPSNATAGSSLTTTLTINDNDNPPNIDFSLATSSASEGNSSTASQTAQVTLDAVSGKDVSANYTISGTATGNGTDHDATAGTVNISNGSTTADITWNVTGETTYENDETIIFTLASATNAVVSGQTTHTFTIVNDDAAPTIAFTSTSASNDEATTSYNVGVTLSASSGVDATVEYSVDASSTATGLGTDYTLNAGTATITAGNTTANIPITIVNDELYEDDETIVLKVSNPTGSSLGTNTTFTYTISNDAAGGNDSKPTIQFSSATGTGSEATTSFNIQLDLSAASGLSSSVDYTIAAGSPAATGSGTDYTIAAGTATITAGQITTDISVSVTNDDLDEEDEKFVVTIANPNSNVSLGTNTTYTYTIQDNDDPPTVQFNKTSSSATEGTNGSLQVDLSAKSGKTVTVNYAVQGSSTATGTGTDYTLTDGTLTFNVGDTTKNITITGIDDNLDENDETVIVLLSSPSNATLGNNTTHTFTINDDDPTPSVQFNATTSTGAEGTANHTVQVDLSAVSGRDVQVPYTVSAGTPAATGGGTDYTLANGTLTISAGSSNNNINLTLNNDTMDEWDEKFIITLGNSPTNATIGTNTTNTFTITDDDAAPTIDFSSSTGSIIENVSPKDVAVTLSAASGKDIAVYYTVTAGSPAATGSGTDYTLSNDSLRISAGNKTGSISPTIINDALDENDEKLVITLSGVPDNVTLGTITAHTLTITDNDDPPTIAFSSINSSGNEAVTPVTLAIELSAPSGLDVTADYTITGTATGGVTDYSLNSGTISISAGDSTASLSATITDDNVVETDETIIVTLSNPTNSTLGTNTTFTYTIVNDDSPPADFTVDTVIATGGTVRFRYWNSTNTGLRVDVPVANSDALVDGTIQLQAKKGVFNYENLSTPYTILTTDKATTKQMDVSGQDFKGITGFEQDSIITITAIITDKYGNSTTGTASPYTVTVDTIGPADFTLGSVTPTGNTIVSGYWNSTNTGISAVIPIQSSDASLSDGSVRLQARSGTSGTWTSIGKSFSVSSSDLIAGTKTITASASGTDSTDIEEISDGSGSDIGDGKDLFFRAILTDLAGNSTTSTQSDSSLLQDQTSPTFSNISSSSADKAYKSGDTVLVSITISETVNVTEKPKLTLETGNSDGQATYSAGTGSTDLVFTYIVASGHTSTDLGYITSSAFSLEGGTIRDVAGNDLDIQTLPSAGAAYSLKDNNEIIIDTQPPSVILTYDDPDTLVRVEDGILTITATFSDSIQIDSIPKISIDFPQVSTGDINAASMIRTSGTVYTYPLTLIDNSTGTITVTLSAYDKALNTLPADSVFGGTAVTIDNTDPGAFTTGEVVAIGDTVVVNWFNAATDNLQITVPLPKLTGNQNDNSLLNGGDVDIQMRIAQRMSETTWVSIPTSDTGNPGAPKDSIKALTDSLFSRSRKNIIDQLTPKGLTQGDTIYVMAVINDAVGNTTDGTPSTSFFVLDTLPPTTGTFSTGSEFTVNKDTLISNDSLYVRWEGFSDPSQSSAAGSGIDRFEYAVKEGSGALDGFRAWRPMDQVELQTLGKTDTLLTDTLAFEHNKQYTISVRAVDKAGNTSSLLTDSSPFLRYNTAPTIFTIADTTAKEDIEYSQLVQVDDIDLNTLRGDLFNYQLETRLIDKSGSNPDTILIDTLNANISNTGKILFTPTKWDTADYVFRVLVTDAWELKDTLDYGITVLPVNDAPIINLTAVGKLEFLEGTKSDTINLTAYSFDEDNDTTELKWSAKILSTLPDLPVYPSARIDFDPGHTTTAIRAVRRSLLEQYPHAKIYQGINYETGGIFLSLDATGDKLKVNLPKTGDSTYASIAPVDTNYYSTSDLQVEFTVTDPGNLEGKDTVTFSITPINDTPKWTGLRDTTIIENDSIYLDFANYLSDVDDSLLTITIQPITFGSSMTIEPSKTYNSTASGVVFSSSTKNDTVKFKPIKLWFGPSGPWKLSNSDSSLIQITAEDDSAATAIDTFVVRVQRVPRPEIRMYVVQNNAFTNFYEVFIVDSVGKTTDLTLEIQSKQVPLDTVAAFTYVGHHQFSETQGNYIFEVSATGVVGDTIVSNTVGLAVARTFTSWSGASPDGRFRVIGSTGTVDYDQTVLIIDSTMFEPYFSDRASYLLGNEIYSFKRPVEISLPSHETEIAIYERTTGMGWIELPSITENGRVRSYTDKMGYFRLGPKTLIVPGMTTLHQNYPNPFNPVTTIVFDLGFVDGPYQKVQLAVYNILGQNVKMLVNDEKGIGRYTVRWNGKDEHEVDVASGIYFVHLMTNHGRSQTKKIMLIR